MARQKRFDTNKVLKDATALFWEKGFHQTSIQDLVDRLDINRASLYDTYHDKSGLFTDCLTAYRNDVLHQVQEVLSEKSVKKGFQNLFNLIAESLSNDINKKGCFVCNTYAELLPSKDKKTHQFLHETKKLWINMILKALKRGIENNEIKKNTNTEEIAYSIYASIIGLSTLSKITKNHKDLKNILTPHLQIFN